MIASGSDGTRKTALATRIVALVAPVLLTGLARAEDRVPITWKGKNLNAASLPKDLGEAPRVAIAAWEPWARAAGYRMDLDEQGRALVLTRASRSRSRDILPLLVWGGSWFDGVLPVPPPRTGETPKASPGSVPETSDAIPEDPEAPPQGSERQKEFHVRSESAWGSGSLEPDSRTATLIALADEKDQESVLAYLGEHHPDLREWAARAAKEVGFVLEIPLVAAYVESASGQEEWSPAHEILNRIVRLLTLRRFGQLPNWLQHAIAWEAETAYDGSIWVYPYRDEFVYTVEHAAWPSEIKKEFEGRASKPLEMEELSRWKPRTWDGACARHAFGFFHYLAEEKADAVPTLLEDFRRFRDANDRKPAGDGTWTRSPDWEPTPEAQLAILKARCGETVLADASRWMASMPTTRTRTAEREESSSAPGRRR